MALDLLFNLRGRLLEVTCTDPDLIAVAAVDGTDPAAPRPPALGPGPELVVAAFNAAPEPRTVRFDTAAPAGFRPGAGRLRVLRLAGPKGGPAIEERDIPGGEASVELGSGEAATLSRPLTGTPARGETLRRRQFFAGEFLREVSPETPARSLIAVDPALPGRATKAWVRVVVERLAEGEGVLEINGKAVPMPAAITPENAPWIRDIPIEPSLLRPSNTLEFRTADPDRAGFLLASASLVIETR